MKTEHGICLGVALVATLGTHAWAGSGRRVEIRATPSEVTLGGNTPQVVELEIVVHDPRAERIADADIFLHATAGRIEGLREVGPGKYQARLMSPDELFPQLAVVSAADLSGVALGMPPTVGNTTVAFSARIPLRGKTEPRISMLVRVGKRKYGPVSSDSAGSFSVPVEVRPGEMWARGTSTDAIGNVSHSEINLYLPEVERIHGLVFPSALVADGKDEGWIFVTTVSRSGAPKDTPIVVQAERGKTSRPKRLSTGVYRIPYRAPEGVKDAQDTVWVTAAKNKEKLTVQLLAGAPSKATVTVEPMPAPADGETKPVVQIIVHDAMGNLVANQSVDVLLDGEPALVEETSAGNLQATLPARTAVSRGQVEVRVTPRSEGCVRGRLIRGTRGWYVVDARGIGCSGRYSVVEPGRNEGGKGGQLGTGGLVQEASSLLAKFAAGSRLEVEGAVPRRVAVYAGSKPTRGVEVAEPLAIKREVVWRLPAATELTVIVLERSSKQIRLRVQGIATEDVPSRLKLRASQGEILIDESSKDSVEAVWRGDKLPVDVIATDAITGVSAWLRIK